MKFLKIDTVFLRSKVARRIFLLFVICALLPVCALAYITVRQVSNEFRRVARENLRQTTKAVGHGTYERLLVLENELNTVAHSIEDAGRPGEGRHTHELKQRLFRGVVQIDGVGRRVHALGRAATWPELSTKELEQLAAGKTVVHTMSRKTGNSLIFMARSLGAGMVVGLVNPNYLWGREGENVIPTHAELFVLDSSGSPLVSSFPERPSTESLRKAMLEFPSSGSFVLSFGGEDYLSYYWNIFLEHRFFTPRWTVVASQSEAQILAPLKSFKEIFLLLFFLSLWVVLFLSMFQIRRNLDPIEKLREGTLKIAHGDLDARVEIQSGDEFEELGESFNRMAGEIKESQDVLIQAELRTRLFLEALPAAFYRMRPSNGGFRVEYVSRGVAALGYTPEQFTDEPGFWVDRLHPEDRDRVLGELTDARGGEERTMEYRFQAADSGWRWILDHLRFNMDENFNLTDIMGIWVDITDRKNLESSLVESESRLRSLSSRLLDAQEEERKRISKELHDDLGQVLTAMLLDIRRASDRPEAEDPDLKPVLGRIQGGAKEALKRVRSLSAALRPGVLDHLGIDVALESLVEDFQERTSLEFLTEIDLGGVEIPEPVKIAIYRIFQEAMTNIFKHADAREVKVALSTDGESVTLEISDDGRGFDPGSSRLAEGIGLLGMRERVQGLGGSFRVASAPGQGTTVCTQIPLSQDGFAI